MEKKFEKKTVFELGAPFGGCTATIESLAKGLVGGGKQVAAQHILECHAEIDRLKDRLRIAQNEVSNLMGVIEEKDTENATLRSQLPSERVWISSETHEKFPETGVWFSVGKEYQDAAIKGIGDKPVSGRRYTLVLHLKDFPVPPKPLEVKVGKYEFNDNGHDVVLDVLAIRTFSNGLIKVIYCYPDGLRSMKDVFDDNIEDLRKRLTENKAVFIGEGESNV